MTIGIVTLKPYSGTMVYESCFLLINKKVWNNSHTNNPDNNLSGGGGHLPISYTEKKVCATANAKIAAIRTGIAQ